MHFVRFVQQNNLVLVFYNIYINGFVFVSPICIVIQSLVLHIKNKIIMQYKICVFLSLNS